MAVGVPARDPRTVDDPIAPVRRYYTERIRRFGPSPAGVDWNDHRGQSERFRVLLEALDGLDGVSLVDLGCGYGALLDVIAGDPRVDSYRGVDISPEMIEAAQELHRRCGVSHPTFEFSTGSTPPERSSDVVVASGIFNVRADASPDAWTRHVTETIVEMARTAGRAFAYNGLLPTSEGYRPRDHLHHSEPADHERLVRSLGWIPTVRTDYGLWEFTVIARRPT